MISLDLTFFYQLGLFLFLMWFLNRVLFRPILAVLDARERAHVEPARMAEELIAKANAESAEYAGIMSETKSDCDRIREELIKDAHEQEHKILTAATADATRLVGEAREKLAAASAQLVAEVDAHAMKLAARLADRLIGRSA
ncbi:MAG: ATP synthase F0 subunit B [Deltaproteobacteria bacterium]|nr:ATP synthase F0 subunit B [Deltaproteobacteria bacterium]